MGLVRYYWANWTHFYHQWYMNTQLPEMTAPGLFHQHKSETNSVSFLCSSRSQTGIETLDHHSPSPVSIQYRTVITRITSGHHQEVAPSLKWGSHNQRTENWIGKIARDHEKSIDLVFGAGAASTASVLLSSYSLIDNWAFLGQALNIAHGLDWTKKSGNLLKRRVFCMSLYTISWNFWIL